MCLPSGNVEPLGTGAADAPLSSSEKMVYNSKQKAYSADLMVPREMTTGQKHYSPCPLDKGSLAVLPDHKPLS
jgi:hypothetical protein